MYRSHTCGELRITDVNKKVQLSGWVQTSRNFGELLFLDVRDRYGITQIVFNNNTNNLLFDRAKRLGREFV
ncbi:MAG TPA: OB-fold nucleic acid binding domain-containing protein, partial [Chitinophagales bacterium]|nr:OB-fold nucleic acid binding domain-containing protein [Chitinophagales bacterium]